MNQDSNAELGQGLEDERYAGGVKCGPLNDWKGVETGKERKEK